MNGRRMIHLALFIIGAVAVMVAGSALADPGDISNPPTEDWFFDSGNSIVIAYRTWDINYNITVANDTLLVFDECTFTFSDPADIYTRWIEVWWNGSMIINNCTFKSTGNAKYYIMVENSTRVMGSAISGMKAPYSSSGGFTAYDSDLTFRNVDIKDNEGVAVWAENCNLNGDNLKVTNSGVEGTDGAGFMALYTYTDHMDSYALYFQNCEFSDNVGRGFGLRAYSNWADIMAEFNGCNVERNGQRGLDIYWGRDGYYESTNASLDLIVSDCYFAENYWDGFRYQQYRAMYDGTAFVNITLEDSTFDEVRGSGAFINVQYGDQTFNIVVNNCDFMDNSEGGRAGLALSNQYITSAWNAEITKCTFTDNDEIGLHIEHRSSNIIGSTYLIKDCDFSGHRDAIYFYNYRYGDYYNDILIEDCDFSGNEGAGFHHHIGWSELPLDVTIRNCEFMNGDGGGIMATASYDASDGVIWDIDDCTFDHLGGYAIDIMLDEVMSGATLDIANCMISDTMGIRFYVMDSMSGRIAEHILIIEGVSITDSKGAAIDAYVLGYYGVGFTVDIKDVIVDTALYNGIRAMSGSNFISTSHSIDIDVTILNVTISSVNGNGLNLGSERLEYRGSRLLDIDDLEVTTTRKAVVVSSIKGRFDQTTISNSLKEDFTIIVADIEVFEPVLDSLDDRTAIVIDSGSVKFWYKLKVYVEWDTGEAVVGAVVRIMDNEHSLIGVYTNEGAQGLPELLLNSFQFRETGMFTRSPYIIEVTFKAITEGATVSLDQNRVATVVLVDHAPPEIFINDPMDGHIQAAKTIDVRGSSYDSESSVKMVEVSIDGVTWIDTMGTTSWQHTFVVSEDDVIDNGGMFTIRARAWDFANNSAFDLITVEVDPFPPYLRVDFPWPDHQTNDASLEVLGVTEEGASVLVNGMEVSLIGTLFRMTLDLVEGPNTITVQAADALGNVIEEKMEVVLDTKPPYVVLLTPEEEEMFTEPTCVVSGQAEDGLTIWVNDAKLSDEQYNNGTFEYVLTLRRGDNLIIVKAMDQAGNEFMETRTVILDDVPPMLAIQSPLDGSHHAMVEVAVIGTTDPDAIVLVNDIVVELDHGLFTETIVGIEGANTIVVVAMDIAGNKVTTELTVHVDLVPPTGNITQPETDMEIVTDPVFTITGTTVGASNVTINGMDYPVEDNAFSVDVELYEGVNRFIITIKDLAGNSVTTERRIILDTIPPVLVVQIMNLVEDDNGDSVFKTEKGQPTVMPILGFTDDAIQVRINGELVPVSSEGYFALEYAINVNEVNSITIVATDAAGNEVTWEDDIRHQYLKAKEDEGFNWGWLILILGLILLVFAIVAGWYRLGKAEPEMEMREVEDEEVMAPAAMPEVEEEDLEEEEEDEEDLEGEEEEEVIVEEEEVHELTPPPERPRTETSRPTAAPTDEVTIEVEEKDLEEKDADAEIGADDTDQEGI